MQMGAHSERHAGVGEGVGGERDEAPSNNECGEEPRRGEHVGDAGGR